jgi:DNA transposition AAA+ family ATPase
MPEIAVVVLAAGMGKTFSINHYAAARPNVFKVTMRPSTATVFKIMGELAELFNLSEIERVATRIDRAVGTRLKRNGRHTLLVVDEAQHLKDDAVNQLRYFFDEYGVGIALVGNEELYGRFGDAPKPAYAQLQSRFGLKVRRAAPLAGDIEAVLDAWAIEDPDIRKLGMAIGRKPGTLRQLTKTLQLAGMIAAGENRNMGVADVRIAAANRGLEAMSDAR